PPRSGRGGDDHRGRHGRDPSLARRAAVELPLPWRDVDGRGQHLDRWPRPAAGEPATRGHRRNLRLGRGNRLAVPPRKLNQEGLMIDIVPVRRALISLSDKSGLAELAAGLARHDVEVVSTGGTAARLRESGASPRDISELTGFPEMMDGRVKTLHPKVHGGLLAVRDNPEHAAAMEENEIAPIDLVVVNLYPFLNTVMSGADRDTIIENIDIGGPSMVRSAAKNHAHVAIVTHPSDYGALLEQLDAHGGTTLEFRKALAAKAFALTAAYDSTISPWFAFDDQGERWPHSWTRASTLKMPLRYGENPHQQAALYLPVGPAARGVAQAQQVQGKELSYNNLNDANAALELVAEFRSAEPTIVIVKHANPCGVATRGALLDAWGEALACDSVSAFVGIVAATRPLDAATAEAITEIFTEVVVAPDADEAAKAIFAKKKNLRLLLTGTLPDPARGGTSLTVIAGGLLVQDRDNGFVRPEDLKIVTKRPPSEQELTDCLFAWTVAKHVKSHAIVYAKERVKTRVGAGQMNRRDSARIAAAKAREAAETHGWPEPRTIGSAVAS